MLALLLWILPAASTPSCLEYALAGIPRRGVEKAFDYACVTEPDQAFREAWNRHADALSECPEARDRFKADSGTPMEALERTGAGCGAAHAKELAKLRAQESRRVRDSLALAEREAKEVRRRKAAAKARFATRKAAVEKELRTCILQDHRDLDSLAILALEPLDKDLYRMVWQAKDPKGRTETNPVKVTLENGVCFFEDDLPDEPGP